MPAIVQTKAIITTIVQVENDDGTAFTLSRTRTSKYVSTDPQDRKMILVKAAEKLASELFDDSI